MISQRGQIPLPRSSPYCAVNLQLLTCSALVPDSFMFLHVGQSGLNRVVENVHHLPKGNKTQIFSFVWGFFHDSPLLPTPTLCIKGKAFLPLRLHSCRCPWYNELSLSYILPIVAHVVAMPFSVLNEVHSCVSSIHEQTCLTSLFLLSNSSNWFSFLKMTSEGTSTERRLLAQQCTVCFPSLALVALHYCRYWVQTTIFWPWTLIFC